MCSKKIKIAFFLSSVFYIFILKSYGQESPKEISGIYYFEPELLMGHIVPNHSNSPHANYSKIFAISLGKFNNSTTKNWASFYNYPFTGISLSLSDLGNKRVYGKQYSIMPYIIFNTSNRLKNAIYFKLGLGGSYFTRHFNETENPTNIDIGSEFTWAFQSFMYYSLYVSKYSIWNIGVGYLHNSNGHIQLPNFGLNQGVISLSAKFFPMGIDPAFQPKQNRLPVSRNKSYLLMVRGGTGIHEYGNAVGPVGQGKRMVESITLSAGILFRQQIKVNTGFAGRFYHQYYYHILNPVDSAYSDKPILNSSNLYFFIGCEFITGHIGINIEGGLNLYKPYYHRHYTTLEGSVDFDYWLKQLFNTKLGLNLYLINPEKKPKTNIFIGANINANFGQADYSELCFGVVYSIK